MGDPLVDYSRPQPRSKAIDWPTSSPAKTQCSVFTQGIYLKRQMRSSFHWEIISSIVPLVRDEGWNRAVIAVVGLDGASGALICESLFFLLSR